MESIIAFIRADNDVDAIVSFTDLYGVPAATAREAVRAIKAALDASYEDGIENGSATQKSLMETEAALRARLTIKA